MNKRAFGEAGERMAARWLEKQGYRLLESNYRAGRHGEIDLIMADGETICFIEVKRRTQSVFGTPAESVDWKKRRTIRQVASCWLSDSPGFHPAVRFDVVEIVDTAEDKRFIRHIREAF